MKRYTFLIKKLFIYPSIPRVMITATVTGLRRDSAEADNTAH